MTLEIALALGILVSAMMLFTSEKYPVDPVAPTPARGALAFGPITSEEGVLGSASSSFRVHRLDRHGWIPWRRANAERVSPLCLHLSSATRAPSARQYGFPAARATAASFARAPLESGAPAQGAGVRANLPDPLRSDDELNRGHAPPWMRDRHVRLARVTSPGYRGAG